MAGFTFSSFHPERISISPPQIMNNIAARPATRTTREIQVRIMSLAVYDELESSTAQAACTEGIKEISIVIKGYQNY